MKKTTTVFIFLVVLMSIAIASDADNGEESTCKLCFMNTICMFCYPPKHVDNTAAAYATNVYDGTPSPTASPGN